MDAETIKSFLVGLGFGVDSKSLATFNASIASATKRVTALAGLTSVASGIFGTSIAEISKGFEQMGYEYHIIAPAINKALLLRQELLKSYRLAGINIQKVVRDSIKLNLSLAKTRFAFEAIYKSVASRFFERLTKASDAFRSKIYANMPKIQAALEKFINFTFKALDGLWQLGMRAWSILSRVYDFFAKLHEATSGWSTIILGVIAAWKLLNLSFLATPLGMIIAGLVAILALFDDFKTYEEGGKSLFNWGPVVPIIHAVANALTSVWHVLGMIGDAIIDVVSKFASLVEKSGVLSTIASAVGSVGNWVGNALGLNSAANAAAAANPAVAPLGGRAGANTSNQSVQQQTTVHIQGVPDAQAAGNAVSGVMTKQNFDLVRNLKGSVKPGGSLQ